MEALEAALKKHNIHVEHSSTSTSTSSSGMALSACRCQSSQSGTGTVHLDNGQFNDVLCVPPLSSNLLSVYQITHSGEGKIVEFSPHDVVIKDLRDPKQILATGIADDSTRLYKFHNFGSSNLPSVFVAHNDEVSKHWHERFGHLNYRSLQHLCKENMVTGLPMVSCRDGVCSGCVLGNIIGTVLKNVPLGTPQPLYSLCTVIYVVHFLLLYSLAANVKGYRLIPFKSKNVFIRRDVKFDENKSAWEPCPADVPPLPISSTFENISSSDDESEDDNPPPPSQDPPLPRWVRTTRDAAEASGHPHWEAAMNEEYHSLLANDTWDLVPLPRGRKLVRCKWVYRTKYGPDGKVDKHKARLVAKGFLQVEGIDYTETFSPVAKMNSIRLVLSLAASLKWEVHQMDVKSAFLHGDLHEEIYMEQPIGFIQTDSSLVCRLKKSLYGLKQAPRAWYAKMDSFLLESGFSRCYSDNTVYTKKVGNSLIILVLYVDDLILTGGDPNLINHVKSSLKKKFEMTDLGHLHYFLGLQVLQSKDGISLSQSKYACDILRHFHMEDCKPAPSPFQS
eukprot:PITA_17449